MEGTNVVFYKERKMTFDSSYPEFRHITGQGFQLRYRYNICQTAGHGLKWTKRQSKTKQFYGIHKLGKFV